MAANIKGECGISYSVFSFDVDQTSSRQCSEGTCSSHIRDSHSTGNPVHETHPCWQPIRLQWTGGQPSVWAVFVSGRKRAGQRGDGGENVGTVEGGGVGEGQGWDCVLAEVGPTLTEALGLLYARKPS